MSACSLFELLGSEYAFTCVCVCVCVCVCCAHIYFALEYTSWKNEGSHNRAPCLQHCRRINDGPRIFICGHLVMRLRSWLPFFLPPLPSPPPPSTTIPPPPIQPALQSSRGQDPPVFKRGRRERAQFV